MAHVRIKWKNSSPNGKVFIRAQGQSTAVSSCPASWLNTPYNDYYIGDYSTDTYFQCSEISGYPSHDGARTNHQYARFRYYPNKVLTAGTTQGKRILIRVKICSR
ncbi:hypothetical protein AGMMS50239_02110 [Bacteroidia bacterium]|nr:hypothetical protein AGMMS50239_02110 [Bacteroidia bacterium]